MLPQLLDPSKNRIQNEFVISDTIHPSYVPFMLYFRGMELIGSETKIKGGESNVQSKYDVSYLSSGLRCATQGCKLSVFSHKKCFVSLLQIRQRKISSGDKKKNY